MYSDAHGGLEALTIASKYVAEGLVEAAIVGAASSIVDPRYSLQFASLGLLSPDGVTRPFDAFGTYSFAFLVKSSRTCNLELIVLRIFQQTVMLEAKV